ncbi:MAG: hypothetical protein ACK551_02895 [Vampirovibrionales bacterium]
MTNFLNSILGALGNTTKTPAKTGAQLSSAELREYNRQAKAIVEEYDTDGNNYLSAAEAKKVPLFKGQDLSTTMFDKLFTGLAQRGMSYVELSRTLQLMDTDRDGEVAKEERKSFLESVQTDLENGVNPNKIYAELSAKALKAGGAKSTDDELRNLKAQFEKYGIDQTDYTPDKDSTDTEEGATGFEKYAPLIEAGLPLLQGLIGNKADTTTTTDTTLDQAQALKLQQEIARLKASYNPPPSLSSPLGSLPSSFASQLPPPLSSPLGLLPELPPDQKSLLGLGSNPLLPAAGNNISPTLMPAQTTFAPPQQPPFTFAQPAPTVATAPASTAWTAPAPVAQDPAPSNWNPLPTTTIAQAPLPSQAVNGGW